MCDGDAGEDVWSGRLHAERSSGVASIGSSTLIKAEGHAIGSAGASTSTKEGRPISNMPERRKPRVASTTFTSESTATPTPLKAQGVNLLSGFEAKPEGPESPPLIRMANEGPLTGAVIWNAIDLHHHGVLQHDDRGAKHGC